ncbi:hypothetical protein MNBD_GAMMA08-612 [hydrothermal vent metagenome]|uniref:DUF4124 domain-containing protein n=1 Tax=hydrothermal vent metagenome TaxID=652676 RepID=A0A3B0XW39_9ZZZZ
MGFFIKLLLKAGITLGVMFIGYKYILTGGSGLSIPGIGDMLDKAPGGIKELGNAVVQKDVTVYQWVDENGVTHYGGSQPVGRGDYTKKEIHANTNVMNAVKPRETVEEKASGRSRVSRIGSIYTPGGIKDTIDGTKDVTQQAEDRMADQEKMLQDIMGGGKKK